VNLLAHFSHFASPEATIKVSQLITNSRETFLAIGAMALKRSRGKQKQNKAPSSKLV
jgi:hypothetical protein